MARQTRAGCSTTQPGSRQPFGDGRELGLDRGALVGGLLGGPERVQEAQLAREREHDEPEERPPAPAAVAHGILDEAARGRRELRPQERAIPVARMTPGALPVDERDLVIVVG